MVDKICNYLTCKIKNEMPDIDEERAQVINYGIHLLIGELPKTFVFLIIAILLGILKEFIITCLVIFPYRAFSGGFHLKTHLGCILGTSVFYCGVPFVSKYIVFEACYIKYILIGLVWAFGIIMCRLYAPADTENIPILRKKERKIKKILSYITLTITLIVGVIVKDNTVSNIIIIGILLQTVMITRIAYRITKNKYGHEVYLENNELIS